MIPLYFFYLFNSASSVSFLNCTYYGHVVCMGRSKVSPRRQNVDSSKMKAGRSHSLSSRGTCGHQLHLPGPRVTVFPGALRGSGKGVGVHFLASVSSGGIR